jgi:tetratricopeptide (TPR) repeat protein
MLAEVRSTDGGTWLSYTGRGYPLTAYMATPGRSQVAVTWQGHADISQLGEFCKVGAAKVLTNRRAEFTMWILTTEGRRRATSLDSPPPLPPGFEQDAKLIRLECRPKLTGVAQLEPALTAWARLDEPSPEDGVAVSIETMDLTLLRTEIAALVRQTAPSTADVGAIIEATLDAVQFDVAELSQSISHGAVQASASKISRDHHRAARDYLRRSLEIDGDSAESLSELAHLLMNDYYSHWLEPNESLDDLRNEAATFVRKALEINPLIPIAHQADGLVHRARGEHEEALDAFDRALQLDPNFARAWAQRANELVMLGRPEEALPFAFKAITLSPRDPALPVFYWIVGRAYFVMEDYKNAIVWLRKSVEMRGDAWYTRAYLISAYALLPGPPKDDLAEDVRAFTTEFSSHTIKRIREVYETENPQRNEQMKTAIDQLSKGLQSAGVPPG